MRYLIGKEPKPKTVPEVTLTIERDGADGSVSLMADGWYILTFNADGTITRCGAVPSELGFKVSKGGHVRFSDEKV